jgi:dTDP-4-amino-4,6-dideoxygalactose transaminase
MKNPYDVVKNFEQAVCEYTGAPYCVAVNSCSAALCLAVAWNIGNTTGIVDCSWDRRAEIEIPRRTYNSVPMQIVHAGARPIFRDEDWSGAYQLKPLPVWDSARRFTSGMYAHPLFGLFKAGCMVCVSFHASKVLGDTQGGAILHDNAEADAWFRKARFDGRTEGVAPKNDTFTMVGYHCYMSNDVASRLMLKMYSLPEHNDDLPNDDYAELDKFEIFK